MYPWQEKHWQDLAANLGRLHHAVLLTGPSGIGKVAFAEEFARRLLCERPDSSGLACGECPACRWMQMGNHPDFRRIVPEAITEPDVADGGESPGIGSAEARRPRSSQIRIDQIRALGDFTAVGAHQSGRRVILVYPAEAMNSHTANALLKLLEEPPSNTYFILVSSAPMRLLPTLRSRCLAVGFPKPDRDLANQWLTGQNVRQPQLALCAAGGMPLEAANWADDQYRELFDWFAERLGQGREIDVVGVGAAWDARQRSRGVAATGVTVATLAGWLQKWVFDLISCRMGGRTTYFVAAEDIQRRIADRCAPGALFGCYNDLVEFRRIAEHPLNARLFVEDMLNRYARALRAGGPA